MSINNLIEQRTMAGGRQRNRSLQGVRNESKFVECCNNNNIYWEPSTKDQDIRYHWDGFIKIDGELRAYDSKSSKDSYERDGLFLVEIKNVNGGEGWCNLTPDAPYWIAFHLRDRNAYFVVKNSDLYNCVYNSIVSHTTDNKEEAKRLKCGYTRINYGRDDLMGYTDEETIKNNCLHKYYHIDPENPRFEM